MLLRLMYDKPLFFLEKLLRCKQISIVGPTGSMEPAQFGGDIAIYDNLPAAECLKVGDVIGFAWEYTPRGAMHRIARIEKEGEEFHYFTKGDASNLQDPGFRTYADIDFIVREVIKPPSILQPFFLWMAEQYEEWWRIEKIHRAKSETQAEVEPKT